VNRSNRILKMDGLEDQAESGVRGNLELLYAHETVEVKHSSRELVITRLCDALKNPLRPLVVRKLTFRSGISIAGLRLLQEALLGMQCRQDNAIQELEFVCLGDLITLQAAIMCCRNSGITRLSLKNYSARVPRQSRDRISETIRSALMTVDPLSDRVHDCAEDVGAVGGGHNQARQTLVELESLEIANFPIGADGVQILEEAVISLKT
jgi:hypothetical protein